MKRLIVWASACAFGLAVATPPQAHAQALEVHPVLIEFLPGQATTTIHVTNQGTFPATIQLRPFAWKQPPVGDDQLSSSEALAFSPPFITLPPGESQVVRLILQGNGSKAEASYRLLLDEIPPPTSVGTRGVRLALHLSIPIFTEADRSSLPALTWQLIVNGQGDATLIATNHGNRHAYFTTIALSGAGFTPVAVKSNGSPYVLAGAERRWTVSAPAGLIRPGAALELTAITNNGRHLKNPVPVSAGP